jgi:hypothetical protein
MNVTDKHVEAALKQLPHDYPTTLQPYVVRNMIEAAMQAEPAIEQEPIYEFRIRRLPNGSFDDWGVCSKEVYERYREKPIEDFWEFEVRALYTNPQPKREPLSDDELNSLRQRDNGKLNFVTLREFREIAKVIEKAHGIGTE